MNWFSTSFMKNTVSKHKTSVATKGDISGSLFSTLDIQRE